MQVCIMSSWARWGTDFSGSIVGGPPPRIEASHPAIQEVSGRVMRRLSWEVEERLRDLGRRRRAREIEVNRARKAVRELLDWERRRPQEVGESRAKRSSSAWRRPGDHCPAWLVTLFDSPNLWHLGA